MHDLWLLSRSSLSIGFDPFLKGNNIRYIWKRWKVSSNNLLIWCENYSAHSLVLFLVVVKAFNYLLHVSIKYVLQMSYTIQYTHKMLYVHWVLFPLYLGICNCTLSCIRWWWYFINYNSCKNNFLSICMPKSFLIQKWCSKKQFCRKPELFKWEDWRLQLAPLGLFANSLCPALLSKPLGVVPEEILLFLCIPDLYITRL